MSYTDYLRLPSAAASVLALILLSGCAGVRYPRSYLLNFPPMSPDATPSEAFGAVGVREFRCPEYLCQGRIVFRTNSEEVGFYEYHRWAVNPRQSITQFMTDSLRTQSLFKHVDAYERGIETPYVLTGRIERLDELDRGRVVLAECVISAELVEVRTGSVLWSDSASETLPLESQDMAGVVNGITAATRVTVDRLVRSMVKKLATPR